MNVSAVGARPAGRPRNEKVAAVIKKIARDLVVRHGYDAVTTQTIAKAAGVSKQTSYIRWRTKADLILDAFLEHARTVVDVPASCDSRPIERQLGEFLSRTFTALETTGPAIRSLMAWAQHDPQFCLTFRQRFIEPRRNAMRGLLEPAVSAGAAGRRKLDAAVIMLYGAVWYRLLLNEPTDAEFCAILAKTIMAGLLPRTARPTDGRLSQRPTTHLLANRATRR